MFLQKSQDYILWGYTQSTLDNNLLQIFFKFLTNGWWAESLLIILMQELCVYSPKGPRYDELDFGRSEKKTGIFAFLSARSEQCLNISCREQYCCIIAAVLDNNYARLVIGEGALC